MLLLAFSVTKLNCSSASEVCKLLELSLSSMLGKQSATILGMGLSKSSSDLPQGAGSEFTAFECYLPCLKKCLITFYSSLVLISNDFFFLLGIHNPCPERSFNRKQLAGNFLSCSSCNQDSFLRKSLKIV